MANTTLSPNMSLPVPVVGVEPGPDYATDQNTCFSILDAHDHTAGSGVQITPNAININATLPLNQNNLTLARSVRFFAQGSPIALPTDIGCLYESGVDLYYNDGSGNQIRMTQSGSIAGVSGSIGGLVSPASATYVSATPAFVFQSAASTAAHLDGGSVILRNITSGSFGLTLAPPTLASNYTLTLPPIPATTKIMSMDSSGNIGTVYGVDNTTVEISSNNIRIKAAGVNTTQLADLGVTISKMEAQTNAGATAGLGDVAVSPDLIYSSSSTAYLTVTNSSVVITVTGTRAVKVCLIPNTTVSSVLQVAATGSGAGGPGSIQLDMRIVRDSTTIATQAFGLAGYTLTGTPLNTSCGIGGLGTLDFPGAGTYTYSLQAKVAASGNSINPACNLVCRLAVYEE